MPLSANLFQLESSIQKHAGSRGAAPVGDAGGAPLRGKFVLEKLFPFSNKNVHYKHLYIFGIVFIN